ncbi:MAG TPA: hypothetical protein VGQ59_04935 [Cyclobacteriaceae bacterium]|jgi:hypothetical protein|nr:hypothetical protein [Cyclobacteriaceae bacterium]
MAKKISNKHYSTDWTADLADINSPNWTKGIEIIKARFESRYFIPVQQLINSGNGIVKYNCGFLVMSIDCLLIETLNQFYRGLKDSDEAYKNKNCEAFKDFFKYSTYFPEFENSEDVIITFYKEVRCGLLHQAESKVNSLINIRESKMVVPIDGINPQNGIIINRALFHQALHDEFNKYLKDLENPKNVNLFGKNLREKCNQKMVALCS